MRPNGNIVWGVESQPSSHVYVGIFNSIDQHFLTRQRRSTSDARYTHAVQVYECVLFFFHAIARRCYGVAHCIVRTTFTPCTFVRSHHMRWVSSQCNACNVLLFSDDAKQKYAKRMRVRTMRQMRGKRCHYVCMISTHENANIFLVWVAISRNVTDACTFFAFCITRRSICFWYDTLIFAKFLFSVRSIIWIIWVKMNIHKICPNFEPYLFSWSIYFVCKRSIVA